MSALLMLTISASVLTVVSDWAGWHFVWRHENANEESGPNKRSITSLFFSYYLPFMPTLAVILGPDKLAVYNDGFATASSMVLFAVLAFVTGGVSASAWSFNRNMAEREESQKLIDEESSLPNHAKEHLMWTTIMLGLCSIFWACLLFF